MKRNYSICLSFTLILTAFLLVMSGARRKEEALAADIAPEILRFHVLANSDSPEDQALKLQVKDLLLQTIRDGFASQTGGEPDKESLCRYIEEHKLMLEETAESFMEAQGFSYPAEVRLEQSAFPRRTYGDMTFPAGTYDAVRVLIGKGEGQNFWCVLYPSLCYLDSTHAVMPDESKNELKAVLPEEDFEALLQARHEKTPEQSGRLPRLQIRLRFLEFFGF